MVLWGSPKVFLSIPSSGYFTLELPFSVDAFHVHRMKFSGMAQACSGLPAPTGYRASDSGFGTHLTFSYFSTAKYLLMVTVAKVLFLSKYL